MYVQAGFVAFACGRGSINRFCGPFPSANTPQAGARPHALLWSSEFRRLESHAAFFQVASTSSDGLNLDNVYLTNVTSRMQELSEYPTLTCLYYVTDVESCCYARHLY